MDWGIFEHTYLQQAILAGFCAGVTCGVVGVFIVTSHLSFLGVCMAHAAFAGALFGIWQGLNPLFGAILFSMASAAVVGPLADRGELSPDSSVGVVFSLMLGLGFLFLGLTPGSRAEALSLFWGSILTVSRGEVLLLLGMTIAIVILAFVFFRELQAVVCHRHVAEAVGIPASLVFYGMLFVTGLTVAVSIRSIGGLLIYSLILNPAAAAFQLTYSFRRMLILSALFGVLSCWAGLAASYWWDLPAGAAVVITSSLVFAISLVGSPKRAH